MGQVLETKTIQVRNDPEEIDEAVQFYGLFFWEYKDTQITNYKNTTYSSYGDVIVGETEHTNYATITFTRNKLMPHYDEIVALEEKLKENDSLRRQIIEIPEMRLQIVARLSIAIAVVIGLGCLFMSSLKAFGAVVAIIGFAVGFFAIKAQKKNDIKRTELTNTLNANPTKEEIIQQARLLNAEVLSEMRG